MDSGRSLKIWHIESRTLGCWRGGYSVAWSGRGGHSCQGGTGEGQIEDCTPRLSEICLVVLILASVPPPVLASVDMFGFSSFPRWASGASGSGCVQGQLGKLCP